MGKANGFIEYARQTAPYRPVEERVCDYREVAGRLPVESLRTQGSRCMDCGIPFCHAVGCPVYNLIPEWNDLVYRGQWQEALERLELTNNLPEITGRVCPAPCESACTLSINSNPVTIKQLELAIIEEGFARGLVRPRPPVRESGKRVAVVGSGPAGLAAAQQLRRAGHQVTVFEKDERVGGILRYGIPDFKLEKWVIDRRIEQMKAEGVQFETGVTIGDDISARYLRRSHDAVLIATGARQPRDLPVPGRDLSGIHFAMEYLAHSNKCVAGESQRQSELWAQGKAVLVIGGGDTGSDCVGTARRQGAAEVLQLEIMPKPADWTETWNPRWPDWPNILRTSSSHEEGCARRWSVITKKFVGSGEKVEQAVCAEVEWKDTGSKGLQPVEVAGTEFTVRADMVLLSLGYLHVRHTRLLEELGVTFDERGNVKSDARYQTSAPGVFVAGDAGTGASLVVRAIWHGRQAAEWMSQYLAG
jgi:glutamate synthase (NADPH/NADH) small chain